MKNILKDKPDLKWNARLKFSNAFVERKDIEKRKVLDIGCGYGWFVLESLKRNVSKIYGTEISAGDLKTARKYIKDKRVDFKVGGALKLPYDSNYFDTVVSWEVIEHIPENTEKNMFLEVNRVLKRGGTFYLSTPYNSYPSKFLDPAWWLIGHRHYDKDKLVELGRDNGFREKKIAIKGRWWSVFSILNMYISKWIFRRSRFFSSLFDEKEMKEYKSGKGFAGIFIKYQKVK